MGHPQPPYQQQPGTPGIPPTSGPPVPPQPGYGPPPVSAPPGHPQQGYPPQPAYPAQPGQGYPAQPGYPVPQQGYPGQAGRPGQSGYPPAGYGQPGTPPGYGQPGQPYPGQPQPAAKKRTGLIIGLVGGGLALVLLAACGIGGFLWYQQRDDNDNGTDLSAVVNYRETSPEALSPDHVSGVVTYPMSPPAGGPHYIQWQNCNGDVYPEPIANGNAVHSLEHGAVWITYRLELAGPEVEKLAERVRGQEYMMLSPYPGQTPRISLQAWGYQLAVESPDDPAIDEFIKRYRVTASLEPGAPCGGGITDTAR